MAGGRNVSGGGRGEAAHREWAQRIDAAFSGHHGECLREMATTVDELEQLQGLLDDAANQLAQAFEQAAGESTAAQGGDLVVISMQYHDICSQLLGHMRRRQARAARLLEDLATPFGALRALADGDAQGVQELRERIDAMHAEVQAAAQAGRPSPVRQSAMTEGETELF